MLVLGVTDQFSAEAQFLKHKYAIILLSIMVFKSLLYVYNT